MAKTVSASKFSEWDGVDRLQTAIHGMKCIFRENGKDDFGIDGEIEVVVPKDSGEGFETHHGYIKAQVKSGKKYVVQNTATSFATTIEKHHLETWHTSNVPVVLIVYHPEDDKLYWKEIKPYLKATLDVFREPCRVQFNKATDELTPECRERFAAIVGNSPPRVASDQKERLYSNLLLVKRFPSTVFLAPAIIVDEKRVREELRILGKGAIPPFGIKDGTLFTFSDPRHPLSILKRYCDHASTEEQRTHQWCKGTNHRDFVYLLNQLFGTHLRRCGLIYSRDFKRNYFPAPEGETSLSKTWTNVRTGRSSARTVTKFYKYGPNRFWRHLAVQVEFRNVGDYWFLQIEPKSFYTHDGFRDVYTSEKVGRLTTTIRAKEHNPQVLLHVLFWSDIFSQQEVNIRVRLHNRPVLEIEKKPLSSIANFALPNDGKAVEEDDTAQVASMTATLALAFDFDDGMDEADPVDEEEEQDDYNGWDQSEEGYYD